MCAMPDAIGVEFAAEEPVAEEELGPGVGFAAEEPVAEEELGPGAPGCHAMEDAFAADAA